MGDGGCNPCVTEAARLQVRTTACVDLVAASGGYMLACTAHSIVAAPFAMVGSIGVIAGAPYAPRPTPYAPRPTLHALRPTPYALRPTPVTIGKGGCSRRKWRL
mgnify:CR=1 FL=1